MPDLLLELFSEEIPARMQAQAAEDLRKGVTDALVAKGVTYDGAVAHVTPRRLALHIAGLPGRQPDSQEERKGPRVGAPEAALAGFLKSAGLTSIDQATIETDARKGSFHVARIHRHGQETVKLLAEIIPAVVKSFPWPKSMRWGKASEQSDSLRWVRPLQSILCTFGIDGEEPEVVHFEVGGIRSGNTTRGHRFMAPAAIKVRRFEDYGPSLEQAKVVLDAARRRDIILHDAKDLAFASGLTLVEDDGLLAEVAGLVEWPVVLMGTFDAAFLAIPPEVIRATIRANQKCFVLRDAGGKLANRFILVSNILASDGGAAIAAGNGRVVRARLSDAKFFWDGDLKVKLEDRLPMLDKIVFQEKLGTQGERVRRIMALAREIAPLVGADAGQAERAAELCKADLVSDMVGEFPELQGLMGRYYATAQGETASVAAAMEDHYKPQGPSDRIPVDKVAIAVALADKIDTLVGFWAIDEKPTGSKDPYALRRAALGVIRIVLENGLRLPLNFCTKFHLVRFAPNYNLHPIAEINELFAHKKINTDSVIDFLNKSTRYLFCNFDNFLEKNRSELDQFFIADEFESKNSSGCEKWAFFNLRMRDIDIFSRLIEPMRQELLEHNTYVQISETVVPSLIGFFIDRLKTYLRDKGAKHDHIDAVTALPGQDDLLMIAARTNALAEFLDTDDGRNLLAGYKRAANILRAEEKKDGAGAFDAPHAPSLRSMHEENILASAIARADATCAECIRAEDFEGAIRALGRLRAPVDAFFEKVTVNDENPRVRINRLQMLGELRKAMNQVADFSKIAG